MSPSSSSFASSFISSFLSPFSVLRPIIYCLSSCLMIIIIIGLFLWYYPFFHDPSYPYGIVLGYNSADTQIIWTYMDYEGYDLLARQNNQSSQSDITGSNRWSPQYMKEWSSYIIYQDVNNIKDKDDIFSSPLLTTTSYTQIHTLTQLQPCTTYQYHVVFSISSPSSSSSSAPSITSSSLTFTTAPLPSSSSCYFVNQEKKNNEKIIVEENNENISALSFIFGSCLGVSAFSSLRAFTYLLSQPVLPTFVILLGDIVYTDIPSIPDHLAYRQIYSDKSFGKLFQNIPFLGIYDDHEIANDWDITANISRYKEAMISFDKFVGDKNPKYKPIGEEEEIIKNKEEEDTMTKPRYFYSRYGSHVSYFVMDTRQYASPISFPADSPNKTKLGYKQLLAVKQWLLSTNTTFKFLCSPVCFSTNCHKPSTQLQDAWAGYLYERNEILNFIEENNINGVIILSADLHWSGVFQIRNFIYEMSISPIQSFPLPAYHTNGEDKTLWKGQMSQMFGQIEIIINKFTNIPAVQFTVYRYLYSTPRPDYELILYPQDLMKNNSRSNNNNKQEKLTGAHEEL